MNLLDWVLIVIVVAVRRLRLLAGVHHRAFATSGCCSAVSWASGSRPRRSATRPPRSWVSLAAVFIVIVCASLGQALFQVRRRPDPRPHHLAAGAGPRRRRRRRTQRAPPRCSSPGRSGSRSPASGLPASRRWCGTPRCWPRSTRCCRPTPARGCRRSTTSSVRRSSRATSSRSRRSGSSPCRPGPRRLLTDPDVPAPAAGVVRIREHQPLRPGHRGLRLRLRARPGDDQRPRRRRRLTTPRRRRRHPVPARVVYYNSELDVAVLSVPTGRVRPLRFASAASGDGARPACPPRISTNATTPSTTAPIVCAFRNRQTWYAVAAQPIDSFVKPGQQYQIDCWVNLLSGTFQQFYISLYTKGTSNSSASFVTGSPTWTMNGVWIKVSATLTAGVGGNLDYAFIKVAGSSSGNDGDFILDDVTIRETTSGRFIYRQVISPSL